MFLPLGTEDKPKVRPLITLSLIIVNIVIFQWTETLSYEELEEIYRWHAWSVNHPSVSGLFGSMFLHGDIFHLIGNMIFLWTFGSYLESVVGRKKFALYYFGGGVAAKALFTIWVLGFMPVERGESHLIGASGAISGIMGAHLIRCYHNRIKVLIGPIFLLPFLPKRFKISSLWVLSYFIAMDLYAGLSNLRNPDVYVAYWSHIGGLLFGIGLALYNREHHPAEVERVRKRAYEWIGKDHGFDQVREDLGRVLKADPTDAWAMVELARVETRYRRETDGESLYRRAILTFWDKGEKDCAATIFVEFYRKFPNAYIGHLPFPLFREVIRIGEHEVAARALEGTIKRRSRLPGWKKDAMLEQAYFLLGKLLSDRLKLGEESARYLKEYLLRYPKGRYREVVDRKLKLMEPTLAA